MADIKDIFGESDSEDEGPEPQDVGKLFELSDDEEEVPIVRKKLKQKKKAPEKPKDGGNAYDSDSEPEESDADRAFIDTEGDDQDLLNEYRNERQDFRESERAEDFEEAEPGERKERGSASRDADNPMAPTLNRMKRQRKKEMGTDEKDKVVQQLLQRMSDALQEDKAATKEGEPAMNKLQLLPLVARVFKNRALRQTLLEFDALDLVREWLAPADDGTLPLLAVRSTLLEAMTHLPAQPEHLKRSGVGRVVMKYARDKKETEANRRLARRLVETWSRPVIGKGVDYKSLEAATEARFKRNTTGNVANVDQKKDNANDIFQEQQDKMAPSHRVRVPQFSGFDFVVRPTSSADPATTGRRKAAAPPDSSKGRLAKKIKRR